MELGIDPAGVSSNKVWWVLLLFTGPPCVFMCVCPSVNSDPYWFSVLDAQVDLLQGFLLLKCTISRPAWPLWDGPKNMRACHMMHPDVWVCEPVGTASLSLMLISDWTFIFGGFCKGRSPEMNSNFGNLNGEKKKKLLLHLKIQHLRLKFLCLFFLKPRGPRRIPLRGPPMILFSVVCICWFDNPVILPSEGDSGSANKQQRG